MPREQENELRHLGNKAFQQMHSSCHKKMPATHLKEASEFDVLSDLKDLSNKADQLAEKKLPDDSGLAEWFDAVRKTIENIRDCKSVNEIQYPPSIKTFIGVKDKNEKITSPAAETTPTLKMTASSAEEVVKEAVPVCKVLVSKMTTPLTKEVTPINKSVTTNTQMVTPTASVKKKVLPFVLLHQLSDQEKHMYSNENSFKNTMKLTSNQTPVLNKTFEKMNSTVILDSGSAKNKKQLSSTANSSTDSGIITRSGSRRKKENECPDGHGVSTRSGSKRKSSVTKNKSSKKQKVDSHNVSSSALNKTAQHRRPLRDLKASVLASENKSKLSAVVKPPVLQKQPIVSKEQQILEEIKMKEKKREENMQRIMAERQQKAEQNKKAREEKRTKTLQKRLQMEKEKEEKRETEAKKSQAKINKENPKKTTRTKELIEQHAKESKSSIITSKTQSISNSEAHIVKTPASRKSDDIESYDLTPVPDSSTYNFSDDEEERTTSKPIPLWAQGVHLKSALMQQYYYPVDTDELFGSVIETPNLVEIFKINKKRYFKRTSSAIWNSPPDRSYYI